MTKQYAKAVKAKCIDCIYDDTEHGNHYCQIGICTSFNCPLWTVRPTARPGEKCRPWHPSAIKSVALTLKVPIQVIRDWNKHPYQIPHLKERS